MVKAAEANLLVAQELDREWPPVLRDLARYAEDRGDAPRAISLLRAAGASDDDADLGFLQDLASPARADLGRNQPCWCESGRKYKVCHLGKESLPIESRDTWLYRKLTRFATEGDSRALIIKLAQLRSAYDQSALLKSLEDVLVLDATLFEGGAAAEFLSQRGHLLPADERETARAWVAQQRSVFEVEDVRVGRGFAIRDVRSADRFFLQENVGSKSVKKGMRLLMHPVPVGTGWRLFGGAEPLPMSMEQAALNLCDALAEGEASPEDLVRFATNRFAPPEVRSIGGQPLVMCAGRYRVDDVAAVAGMLDIRFGAAEQQQWSWLEDQGYFQRVLATLELEGTTLTVSTMNEERFEALRHELDEIEGLTFLDADRVSAEQMMQRAGGSDEGAPEMSALTSSDVEDDPGLQEALDNYARTYEDEWLDMSIPALGGATPRQAVDDPTRRDDLIRLLDSFDGMPGGPGSMRPDRLRVALGL